MARQSAGDAMLLGWTLSAPRLCVVWQRCGGNDVEAVGGSASGMREAGTSQPLPCKTAV